MIRVATIKAATVRPEMKMADFSILSSNIIFVDDQKPRSLLMSTHLLSHLMDNERLILEH